MGAVKPRVIVATLLLLINTACTSGETLSTRDEAVIVYGGFGLVDKRAQPELNTLLFDPPAGTQSLGIDARSLAIGRSFDRFSLRPVIGDAEAFRAALGTVVPDGELPDQIDATDILVLSLFGTTELAYLYAPGEWGAAFVSVSAVISRAGSGEILMVRDATGVEYFSADAASWQDSADRRRFFASLYAQKAEKALSDIGNAPILETAGARAMLTDVRVVDTATAQQYGSPSHGRRAGACTAIEECETGPLAGSTVPPCLQLRALAAQLATQALAEKDVPTLPPWGWSSAASMAEYEAFKTTELLRLPTTGGFRARDDIVRLRIPEAEASRKFVVEIGELTFTDAPAGANLTERRYALDLGLVEFNGTDCATARPASTPERVVNPRGLTTLMPRAWAEDTMPVGLELSYLLATARQQLGLLETEEGGLLW